MRISKIYRVVLLLIPLFTMLLYSGPVAPTTGSQNKDVTVVDVGNGQTIEVGPDEVLYKYEISAAPTTMSGTGSPLTTAEYGTRTDPFSNLNMVYDPATQTTTTSNQSVPVGDNWEAYQVFANITDITENRTWLVNQDFDTETDWRFSTNYSEGAFNGNNRVQFFSSTGTFEGTWGSRGTLTGQFIDPWGIAVNSTGYVYVVDSGNHRVQIFDPTGNYVGGWGTRGSGQGQFNHPMGIAIDSSDNVYVVDQNNDRIQVFGPNGNFLQEWGSSGTGNGQFHQPTGIAIRNSNGYVYVTDTGNDRVQYFDSNGIYLGQWGSTGTGTGSFRAPTGIGINQNNGEVIVADSTNNRVQRFSATGTYLSYVGYYAANGASSNGYFRTPIGVAVSSTGTIYVCDIGNYRVQYFTSTGSYVGRWGSQGTGNGQFRFNYGIAINSTGHVYVAERSGTTRKSATWLSNGHGAGDPAATFRIDGYWHTDPTTGLYGFWYNPGDKSFIKQILNINRGDITWAGVSLDYYADCRGWSGYMTGFFELFVSLGDPDATGDYLWKIQFDGIADDNIWYSTGLVTVDYTQFSLPTIPIVAGLRVTQSEWYRTPDILPEGRIDNLVIYIKARATPEEINLQMNGVNVNNVLQGSTPLWGRGTAMYRPPTPWRNGKAYANFSWTPTPLPPDPNLEISVEINALVTAYARRYNIQSINNTATFSVGDNYQVENATIVSWETNHYVAVPGGYEAEFFFNTTIPLNRDITHVGQPNDRFTNLTTGVSYGNPGDGLLNVSVYEITTTAQNGFWLLRGNSPNMITNLEVWDPTTSQWTRTYTFRANDQTRFRATLPASYAGDYVNFTVYDSTGSPWTTLQGVVDSSGYAITSYVTLDPTTAPVGDWEVQAYCSDRVSGAGLVHNIGYFRRGFSIQHATNMYVKYPVDGVITWKTNVTYGDVVLLQLRVNDSDNGDLLPGGIMTYSWANGSGTVNDLGTGEYSVTFNTSLLSGNGAYPVTLTWSKPFYDSIIKTFTINVIFTSNLFSPDAPGVDVPKGYDAELTVHFEDQLGQGITGATILTNWTFGGYTVTPVVGNPGYYTIALPTTNAPLGLYDVEITASKDFVEPRTIILSVQVRELFTSAIPSTSYLSLPVGYVRSFTVTYTDTDHDTPITGSESSFFLNWSGAHGYYTVAETTTPGVYNISIFSLDTDTLGTYVVQVDVLKGGAQNHTFYVEVELRTHLTSFYLANPVDPTPYTDNFEIRVVYFDVDANVGIENGSAVGYNVLIYVTSSLPSLSYTVANGSSPGEYLIIIPASQWGSIGAKNLTIYANWTGPTVKYTNETIGTTVTVTATPTDIYIGISPVMTPYGENISFSLVYYDVGGETGIVNSTGPYAGNVHLTITVLTPGQSLDQSKMVITEIDTVNNPGEYLIEFDSDFLSGLITCDLEVWFNWTKGQLPLYENKTLVVTVQTIQRQTTVERDALPITPYDELVNLSFYYRDSLSGQAILNSSSLYISIQEPVVYTVYYMGDATGEFRIELDTSSWIPGTHVFHLNITWVGSPFYQNRTTVEVSITVRYRYTELTHGSYSSVQFGDNLTLLLYYRDLDDYTTTGMNGGTLTLDASLTGFYWVQDNGDGTYTLTLDTTVFGTLGSYIVNASIVYGGIRYCENATDFFYVTVVERRTQLLSELPGLAPYLTQANITIHYTDDATGQGIAGASIFASCFNASTPLEINVNYWVDYQGAGTYYVRISTVALGNFGSYNILIVANYTGSPYYREKTIVVAIEVSRRPISLSVTKSPLNTAFLDIVSFEIVATDGLNGSAIAFDKTKLQLSHGAGLPISDSEYTISGTAAGYTISINSTVLVSELVAGHPITIKLFWGDVPPYYTNSTATTEVTITERPTQLIVISTPPADIFYNASATLEFSDYKTGTGISGATVTVRCLNESIIQSWLIDNGDGTYEIRVNTSTFSKLGRYYFEANVTFIGSPYYQNRTGTGFSILVNPVATTLSLEIPSDITFYSGDVVMVNITFTNIATGIGITNALVQTDWMSLHGTAYSITEIGGGIYNLTIQTSGLDAGRYVFTINASKYLHYNKSVVADIVLASIPVSLQLTFTPLEPIWGDLIQFDVNLTDARDGSPITGATVVLTIAGTDYPMSETGGGIYSRSLSTTSLNAGDYRVHIHSELLNYETRDRDFQIRIAKVSAALSASLTPPTAVNGQTIYLEAVYALASNNTPITNGNLSFSWSGGSGVLIWDGSLQKYVGQFNVTDVPIGSYQISIYATSTNYRSASIQLTIEIREIVTELVPYEGVTTISVIYGDLFNVTVYLNNTDLNQPIDGANVTYSVGSITGNMTSAVQSGYYTALIPSSELDVRNWILTVSSAKEAHTPAATQFIIRVLRIPTKVEILTGAQVEVYYGENATIRVNYWDIHNDIGVQNATVTFALAGVNGTLLDLGNGTYVFTLNSTIVSAGAFGYDIFLLLQKDKYETAFSSISLLVRPIPTIITGVTEIDFPVGDDYSLVFTFLDTLNNRVVAGGTASAIWEFGTVVLTPLGNGSYVFGPNETGIERLEIRSVPYSIRILITKGNYTLSELKVQLTIRLIRTTLIVEPHPVTLYENQEFTVRVTYWDLDHNRTIPNAINTTEGTTLDSVPELTHDYGNGTYVFGFVGTGITSFDLRIRLEATDYEPAEYSTAVYTVLTPEQQALVTNFGYLGLGILLLSALAALYIKVLSVPKLLRIIMRQYKQVRKGKVPLPATVRDRRTILVDMMNEDLEPVRIVKTDEDVAPSTVDVSALDVEVLLSELAELVGLTEADVNDLRTDLDKMPPSERAGFVLEVIKQERARRAKELAEAKEEKVAEELKRKLTEEELAELKERLIALGIEESEASLMVEQARNLTKAEVDALLEQLGGKEE